MCRQLSGIISIQSHVTYGHAGNSVAVPTLQLLGYEVFPIHTVLFSNHTQYAEGWKGAVMPPEHITDIFNGLRSINVLGGVEAVLTGYMGSPAQVDAVIQGVSMLNQVEPLSGRDYIWVMDPVMPDPKKGCKMAPGMPEAWRKAAAHANVITPNQYELEQLTEMTIENVDDLKYAIKRLRNQTMGAHVVVKDTSVLPGFAMCTYDEDTDQFFYCAREKYEFDKAPVGVGDLVSAAITSGMQRYHDPLMAMQHAHGIVDAVVHGTYLKDQYELDLIHSLRRYIVDGKDCIGSAATKF